METSRISLPGAALYACTALALLLLLWGLRNVKSRSGAFAIFAVWARYILTFYHQYTVRPIAAGLSGNALGSIGIIGLGMLVIQKKNLLLPFLWPIYGFIAVIVLSGLANGEVGGAITALTKYVYLLVLTIAVYEALGKTSPELFFPKMLWALSSLLLFQIVSVALGVVKPGEDTGADSYIGGYSHEAAFSVALATFLLVVCLSVKLRVVVAWSLAVCALAGILLANYRTTVIAMTPLIFAYFALPSLKRLTPEQRPLIWGATSAMGVILLLVGVVLLQERLADIGRALSDLDSLIKPASQYSPDDQRILSGRPYIWSHFIYAYIDSADIQHVLGSGPETWDKVYKTYAHNTLVSYLYEYGILGVLAIAMLWGWMLNQAMKVRSGKRAILTAGHITWIIMNMATMPHWLVEGNAFYAVLCGCTLYERRMFQAVERRRIAVKSQP